MGFWETHGRNVLMHSGMIMATECGRYPSDGEPIRHQLEAICAGAGLSKK